MEIANDEISGVPEEIRERSTIFDLVEIDFSDESLYQYDDVKALENEITAEALDFDPFSAKTRASNRTVTDDFVLSESFLENRLAVDSKTIFDGNSILKNNNSAEISRAVGNNTPDMAIYLGESYYDVVLSDYIIENEVPNWYYVYVPSNMKINFYLQQAPEQDCDVYLYKLNLSTGVLSLVDYSINEGQSPEKIAYIDSEGYYFICVEPYGNTNKNNYAFVVNANDMFDQYEINDYLDGNTPVFTDKMDINATIDNMFDEDWYIFTPTSTGRYYVSLNNAPSDAQYAFFLYNSSLGSMGAFVSSGNESRWVNMEDNNTYYIRVESYDGNFAPRTPYNVTVIKAPPLPPPITTSSTQVFVDGNPLDIKWDYIYFSPGSYPDPGYYSRRELTSLDKYGTSTIGNVYKGTFKGFNKTIQNALLIEVNYISFYDYLARHGNTTQPSGEPSRNEWYYSYELYGFPYGTFIYNIDTGKIEDCIGSYPYIWHGITPSFTITEIIRERP